MKKESGVLTEYSHKIQVRCSKSLFREIKKAAKRLDMTASNYVRLAVQHNLFVDDQIWGPTIKTKRAVD